MIILSISGNITGLIPHTEYKISMVACTGGGCAESPDRFIIHTKEEGMSIELEHHLGEYI